MFVLELDIKALDPIQQQLNLLIPETYKILNILKEKGLSLSQFNKCINS